MVKKKQIGEEVLKDIEDYAEKINMTKSNKTGFDVLFWVMLAVSVLVLAFGIAERNRIVIVIGAILLILFAIRTVYGRE